MLVEVDGRDDGGGGSGESDGDGDERTMSAGFVAAGRVGLSTESGKEDPSGVTIVTADVETSTTVIGVGMPPAPEVGKLVVRVVVCTGMPVVNRTNSPRSSSNSL